MFGKLGGGDNTMLVFEQSSNDQRILPWVEKKQAKRGQKRIMQGSDSVQIN